MVLYKTEYKNDVLENKKVITERIILTEDVKTGGKKEVQKDTILRSKGRR